MADSRDTLDTAESINGVIIRLTFTQWQHVLDEHSNDFSFHDYELVLDTVADPEYVLRAQRGALAAVIYERGDFLHVFYRELDSRDGFIITTRYESDFDRNKVIWRKYENDNY